MKLTKKEMNAIYELIQIFDQSKLEPETLNILENLFEKLNKKLSSY